MNTKQIDEMIKVLSAKLNQHQQSNGMWRGQLSSSAISTSVSVFALYMIDKTNYAPQIERGAKWLKSTMTDDGSWGDSIESPSNLTATLLTYACLYAVDVPHQKTKEYLAQKFGGTDDIHIIEGVLAYYGKDLTFSVPILMMCALAGVISDWEKVPQFPFEVSVLPQQLFRFFRLPVVSYAIPALIAVGILRFKKGRKNILSPIRNSFINKSLRVLEKLQPSNGGFLEAAPLTAFVAMCMCGSGYQEHSVTLSGAKFLVDTVRADGAWPIDTDLASWVTSLSVKALGNNINNKETVVKTIKQNAFKEKHPFTGAQEGGWGWSNLPGAAPDADDTSGALVALHILTNGTYSSEIGKGIEWLLDLQNGDGGMPTFCKGWGKLPFDRSSADISAHSILAFELWHNSLPADLKERCRQSTNRLIKWMQKSQSANGSWTPLWFGDQDAEDERSPVYGTSMAVEYLSISKNKSATEMVANGTRFILSAQNDDGGWGGAKNAASKVTITARALSALASLPDIYEDSIESGFEFLWQKYKSEKLFEPEPIGLYFARLWYSEELYNITFVLNALNKLKTISA